MHAIHIWPFFVNEKGVIPNKKKDEKLEANKVTKLRSANKVCDTMLGITRNFRTTTNQTLQKHLQLG